MSARNRAVTYNSASPTDSPTEKPYRPGSAKRTSSHLLPAPGSYGSESKPFFASFSNKSYFFWRLRRLLSRPLPWVVIIVFALLTWWSSGAGEELSSPEVQLKLRELFPPEITRDLQFYPASNPKIHYVGRWTASPNRLRFDGTFPGVYFELNVTNTSSLVLSLQNAREDEAASKPTTLPDDALEERSAGTPQYRFSASSKIRAASPPISLLALVDGEEYVVLPNATSLVTVRMKDMNPKMPHTIRVIAPMTDSNGRGLVQLDGIWVDKGGALLPVEGTMADDGDDDADDDLTPESDEVGKKHRLGLSNLLHRYQRDQPRKVETPVSSLDNDDDDDDEKQPAPEVHKRKRLIEIITDQPSHIQWRRSKHQSSSDSLLAGVMGWDYLLGEMFSVDHVCVGVKGSCLIHNCAGGEGAPNGMGDVFFRSGPADSPHFSHPWSFRSYVPDVLVINLGASDASSFEHHRSSYDKSSVELMKTFEDTYVSFVKAIRNLAYPQHPSIIEQERLGLDANTEDDSPANIPIFIMRPFNGELEHATQGAVNRLRQEGDMSVYWLDTTGWLDLADTGRTASDFFVDPEDPEKRLHLTERGNQKAAIYLHMHVCRFLAADPSECAFLPPEVYQGEVFDPTVSTLDRYIENEKARQMKELFWDEDSLAL